MVLIENMCVGYEFYGLQFPHGWPSPGSVECWCGHQRELDLHSDRENAADDCDERFGAKFKMVVAETGTGMQKQTCHY